MTCDPEELAAEARQRKAEAACQDATGIRQSGEAAHLAA